MPEEVLELPVHCIIQCQRRFWSFPSTVLYSARGDSGASGPLHHTVPEEVPELPVHCMRRFRSMPSTVSYSARGGSGASRPLYYTVPEEVPELPVHYIIQCQRRFRSFRSIVLYSVRGGSGASGPLWHCIIQWTGSSGTSSGIRRNLSWGTICIVDTPPSHMNLWLIYG